jgi:TonB family protein
MNCADIATVLAERSQRRASGAVLAAINAHLATCDDCAVAWRAEQAVLSLEIAAPSRDELMTLVRAAIGKQTSLPRPRRLASRTIVLGALLTAGAALAAVATVDYVFRGEHGRDTTPAATQTHVETPAAQTAAPPQVGAPSSPGAKPSETADLVRFPDGDYFMLLVRPPHYPPAALDAKLEGSVNVRYTVTAEGNTADVEAVESSDPQFAPNAVLAVTQWKYMPRVVDGKRVAVPGVHTVIRFALVAPELVAPGHRLAQPPTPPLPADGLDDTGFDAALEPAWDFASAGDLRRAELVLDEIAASHTLAPRQVVELSNFYAYIYTQYGDYGRAIGALHKAIDSGGGWRASMTLAHLYFVQHQYDLALATLRDYAASSGDKNIDRRFIDKLEQLGLPTGGL